MKRVKLCIHEPVINKVIGNELNLLLDKNANIIDVIRDMDKIVSDKRSFPVSDYRSLLHVIYNPKSVLYGGTVITLIPAGGCISE